MAKKTRNKLDVNQIARRIVDQAIDENQPAPNDEETVKEEHGAATA